MSFPRYRVRQLFAVVTDTCASRCAGCNYWQEGTTHLDPLIFRMTIERLAKQGLHQVMLTGGEPLNHPEFPILANDAKKLGVTVKTATSGLQLTSRGSEFAKLVDQWTVSLDAVNPNTYRILRGVRGFDKVLNGLDVLRVEGVKFKTSFLIYSQNYRQLPNFIVLSKRMGAAGVSLLVPDFRGTFGLSANKYRQNLLLNKEQVLKFESYVLPEVRARLRETGIQANFTLDELSILGKYLRWMADGGPPPRLRKSRCSVPLTTLVIRPDQTQAICFYFPERVPIIGCSPHPQDSQIMKLRSQALLDEAQFQSRCQACLQVTLCQSQASNPHRNTKA